MSSTSVALAHPLAHRFTDGIYEEGLSDVLRGLLYIPRQLSHTWLYDERGCRLLEKICDLPEHYPVRTETGIMQAHAREMAAMLGDEALAIIQYGSDSGPRLRWLLNTLSQPLAYVPIDFAGPSLARAARALRRDYPRLLVLPVCAEFTRRPELPLQLPGQARRLLYMAGSTLGNYEPQELQRMLTSMRELAGPSGAALVGIDLCADPGVLERAYNDSRGLSAEFNLNALRHANRRLGIGFEISHFRHRAVWAEAQRRIELQLVSTVNQSIRLGAAVIRLLRGDFIRTQCRQQYTLSEFARVASHAGWAVSGSWTDSSERFAVQLLAPV
jgi:dimethylhistidine N-methyltransferase